MTTEDFMFKVRPFVEADFTNKDLKYFSKISDSTDKTIYKQHKFYQKCFIGKLKTVDGSIIEFNFCATQLKKCKEQICTGNIKVFRADSCKSIICPTVFSAITVNKMGFDSIKTEDGFYCNCVKMSLYFEKFHLISYKILQKLDKPLAELIKNEYYDFYFGDANKKTATWQLDPEKVKKQHSAAIILLIKNKQINNLIDLIKTNNQKYSWILSEGLWYYNSLYPILTKEQIDIVDSYNGKNGLLSFRNKEQLEEIYKY